MSIPTGPSESSLSELLEKGKIEQVLQRLKDRKETLEPDQQDDLILFSSQWETLQERIKAKTIREADREVDHSRIVLNLIHFVNTNKLG